MHQAPTGQSTASWGRRQHDPTGRVGGTQEQVLEDIPASLGIADLLQHGPKPLKDVKSCGIGKRFGLCGNPGGGGHGCIISGSKGTARQVR